MSQDNKEYLVVTIEELPLVDTITKLVQDDSAGATTVFIGTTRDSFKGKRVIQLEYEAYKPMAIKILQTIIDEARLRWRIQHVAIYHRVGCVPVGQASVIAAVSSTHRGDSINSAAYLIDELKERCPIWKKEVYEDGSVWKGACEGTRSDRHG
ncbi:molybdenum cofactor synthesis protein 2 large subunit [Phycomyces nitens]|nr:molybdenum cofactor synthesis protein 2 large subunit [Phycomyces nitens]